MVRVCLVTDELHPITAGGIGRLLHNLILQEREAAPEVAFHLLVPEACAITPEGVRETFGDRVACHRAPMRQGPEPDTDGQTVYPPAVAFTDCDWHAQSLDFLRALRGLGRAGLRFDVVEFPDFRGWAFCTLQEKLLGTEFRETLVSVRIHSTDGVLSHFEPRPLVREQAARFELERKALADAERVVAHLPAVARFNQEYYGFEPSWLEKVSVEFPPVVEGSSPRRAGGPGARDLLFPTKLQPIKQPELFVRGAATFMAGHPEFTGRAVLACHAASPEYRDQVKRLVPDGLAHRFAFLPPGPERERLMSLGIVVVPSAYESCNLTAYEASAAGGILVLNGACPAFGEDSPFRDRVNCYKFDGSVEGLAEALERAWRDPAREPVARPSDPPYWRRARELRPSRTWPETPRAKVSVLVTNYNLAEHLPQTLASAAASSYRNLEVIVVDDCSTEPLDRTVLDRISREGAGGLPVRVIRNPINRGLPAARNIGLRAATGEYVLPLDADDAITPEFIELAVRGLEACPEYDVVVPTAGFFRTDVERAERRFCGWSVFLGDAPSLGLLENRLSTATSLIRRSALDRFRYDENLDSYEDWDLYARMVHAGARFLVTGAVHFHYRARPGSMVRAMSPERHHRLRARIAEKVRLPRGIRLFPLLVGAAMPEDRPLVMRYRIADKVNDLLKAAFPGVHPILKRLTGWVGRRAKKP